MIKATDYKRISGYVISRPLIRFEYVALVLNVAMRIDGWGPTPFAE
jgi:hypothetical protein